MGKIDIILSNCNLPERDDGNSRGFVDLGENVHIHWRDLRIVFSVQEYKLFSKMINESVLNLEKQIENGYKESPDLKDMEPNIIGGSQTEYLDLPEPKKSAYFDNRFQIEKQESGYGDLLHLHFRDYRLVLRKYETWKKFCETVAKAWANTKAEWFKE